jgi:hypothetical protein
LLAGFIGLLILFFATMPMSRRRHLQLARRRRRMDGDGFERAMGVAGVTPTTARFLWRELQPFYHAPLAPMPEDRLESLIWVDRPEIDGLVGHFWQSMRGHDARPVLAPLGNDPTVAELGRHCDLMAGWSIRGSA